MADCIDPLSDFFDFLLSLSLLVRVVVSQLPQTETDSNDLIKCRRFRLENGEGVGERDDVSTHSST